MGAAYSEEDEAHTTGSSSTISDYYNCYKLLEEVLPQKKEYIPRGDKYPHLHCETNFFLLSLGKNDHKNFVVKNRQSLI